MIRRSAKPPSRRSRNCKRSVSAMPPKNVDSLANEEVRRLLAGARVAHLATSGADGAPHNVPICFWFDGAAFYFAIDEKPKRQTGGALKRMRNIASNPRVALLIDHYEEDWAHLAYVLVHGVARVIENPEEY